MPSSWLNVRSLALSWVAKVYEVPWLCALSVLALAADVVRASAPAARSPDATVVAAIRRAFLLRAFLLSDFMIFFLSQLLVQCGGSAVNQDCWRLGAIHWGDGGTCRVYLWEAQVTGLRTAGAGN